MNVDFEAFLKNNAEALGKLLQVAEAFRAQQLSVPKADGVAAGPDVFAPGKSWAMTTIPIAPADLQNLYAGYGTAVAKEKAIEWIKGFFQGVMLVGGAL